MGLFSNIKSGLEKIPGLLTKEFSLSSEEEVKKFKGKGFTKEGAEKGMKTAADFLPGKEILQGLAVNYFAKDALKKQKRLDDRHQMLQDTAIKMLNDAREKGDKDKEDKVKNILSEMGTNEPDRHIDTVLEKAPTTQQVIGDAVEASTFVGLGGVSRLRGAGKLLERSEVGAIKAANRARKMLKVKNATKLGKVGLKTQKYLKEAGIGSVLFSAFKAQEPDADAKDIVHAGELGAFLGPVFMGLTELGIKGASKSTNLAKKYIRKVENKAEQVLAGTERVVTEGKSQIEKTLSLIGENLKPKEIAAKTFIKGVQGARQWGARLIDRTLPLKRIQGSLEETLARPLKESEKVYRDARLLESASNAKAEKLVMKLQDDLRAYNDLTDEATAYLTQLDLIDRKKLGQKVAGGQSLKELNDGLRKIIQEVGPEDMRRLGRARQVVRDYHRSSLKERVEAGLISKGEMNKLLETHPNYIPHNVVMDMEERSINAMAGSFNVSKTDLMKAVGSTRNIQNPFAATIQRTPITTRTIEKNKLLRNIVRAQEENKIIPGMRKMKGGEKISALPSTQEAITLFRNGKKEKWAVPKDVGVAIKNLDSVPMPGYFKGITAPQQVLKKGATGWNLSFAIPNKFRDKQTAALTSEAFIRSMAEKTGVSPKSVNLSKEELLKLYKESGGFGASIFREGEDEIFKRMKKAGVGEKVSLESNTNILRRINEKIEQSTRMEVFKKGLSRGLSPKDAALVSRDATIDFARMGSWMRPANRAIPFLNARLQGFVNLPRAAVKKPETFARMQLWTGVYPTMLLHQHNRRFESYDNIGNYWKNRYWVIMTGETKTKDAYTGNDTTVPHFITIPKGEGQTLVSTPIQWYLDKMDKRDYRKTSEMLADTLGSASPLEFQSFNEENFYGSVLSQLGPMATVPAGLATNENIFYGRPIIPGEKGPGERREVEKRLQTTPTTPETTEELANIIGESPAYVEFFLNSFGGLPKDVQSVADMIYGLWDEESLVDDLKEKSLSRTVFGAATKVPVGRRFLKEASEFYSTESEFNKDKKEKIKVGINTSKVEVENRAKEIVRKLNTLEDGDEKKNYLSSLGDELNDELLDEIVQEKSFKAFDVLTENDPVELRARYLLWKKDDLRSRGVSESKIREFLSNAMEKGILTDETIDEMYLIKQTEK